jgi:PKD repeat protein
MKHFWFTFLFVGVGWYWAGAQHSSCLFTAPFSENFDGSIWVSGSGSQASLGYLLNVGNQIDTCWSRPPGTNQIGVRTGVTGSSPSTGPTSDVSGSGNYLLLESSFVADTGEISSPYIYIPNTLTNPHLKFNYHMSGVHIDSLVVMMDTGSGFHSFYKLVGEQQFSHHSEWLVTTADLSAYAGDTLQFKFKGYYRGWTADISIDEVSVESLTCGQTKGVNIATTYKDSLQLNWDGGSATHWQVEYGPAGFSPGNGTRLTASTSSFTVSGLSTSVTYDFYVRDSCGVGDVGFWSSSVRGGVLCDTILIAPWEENFDGPNWQTGYGIFNSGNIVDQCWTRPGVYNGHFGTHTGPTGTNGTGPNVDVSGSGNYIYSDGTEDGPVTGQISTPLIYIPDTMYNPQLKFNYHMYGADIQNFRIRIDSGTGFLPASYILLNQQQTSSGSAWKSDSISLNDYLGDTIQIRFIGHSDGNNGDIALDEVEIMPDSSSFCPEPDSVSITNIASKTATVNWVSAAGVSDVEVVLLGQAQGSGNVFTNVTPPLNLTNLMPDTTYVVYITDSCSAVALSKQVIDTFTTAPCPQLTMGFSHNSNLLSVNFNSSSTVNADSLYWDFGDGNNSSQPNPNHSYQNAGSYVVSLAGFNVCDSMQTFTDTIRVCDSLIADFSVSRVGDSVGVSFTGSSVAVGYQWDFGGVIDTSGPSTNYRFGTPGMKNISLTIFNLCGDTASISKQVQVCLLPEADWTYNIIGTTSSGMEVQFDGSASANATGYQWDFGDGNDTSGVATPKHIYTTPGLSYLVTLIVTNACGDRDTLSGTLQDFSVGETGELARVEVYPNPMKDVLIIRSSMKDVLEFKLFNSSGQIILESVLNSGENKLSVRSLPMGSYILFISNPKTGETKTQVIVK